MRLPITFYKAGPTEFVVKFVAGNRRVSGVGPVYFIGPRTTLVKVPTMERVIPFMCTELTADNQQVVVQGNVRTRCIVETVLQRLNCTIDPWTGAYLADENPEEKISEETRFVLQRHVRSAVRGKDLRGAVASVVACGDEVRSAAREQKAAFAAIGVEVLDVYINAIDPANPDLKRALEAEAREQMLAAADKAVATRRMDASRNDRALKEYEAETARTLEEGRKALIEVRNANVVAEAEADAAAITKRLDPYLNADPRVILALGLRELANGKVAQVTITPDLLAAVTKSAGMDGARGKD